MKSKPVDAHEVVEGVLSRFFLTTAEVGTIRHNFLARLKGSAAKKQRFPGEPHRNENSELLNKLARISIGSESPQVTSRAAPCPKRSHH